MLVVNTVLSPQGTKAAFTSKGSDLQAGALRAWKSGKSRAGSLALCRAHPTCPPIMSGLDRPPGTCSSACIDRQEPGALEQKGLSQVQSVWSQISLPVNEFLSLFQPLPHPAQPTTPPPHPYPGYNCSSQEQPAARQFQEERLLLSKPVIKRALSKRPSCPKPEKKDSLMPDGVWVAVSPFLAPGFQSRLQVHLAVWF